MQESRNILHKLRRVSDNKQYGADAIFHLAHSLHHALGIIVEVSYGNAPKELSGNTWIYMLSFDSGGNYKCYQAWQSTTYSYFAMVGYIGIANTHLNDNIKSTKESSINEGIGIKGMRERLNSIGGNVTMRKVEDGFELLASVPLLSESKTKLYEKSCK